MLRGRHGVVDEEAGQHAQLSLLTGLPAEIGVHTHIAPSCGRNTGNYTRTTHWAGAMLGIRAAAANLTECLSLQSSQLWGRERSHKQMRNCTLWGVL